MTWLEFNDAMQEVPTDSEVIVGTGAQATWRLRRADLMPRHFIVSASSSGATIRPFSSDAIVSLNGRQLSAGSTRLEDGDVISAGSGRFRFWAEKPSENRSALPAVAPAIGYLIDGSRSRGPAVSLNRISTGIGRDESNTILLDDAASFEAEIRREAGGHALRVASPSSVRVNGKPVTGPLLLSEGDEIQIGQRLLSYTLQQPPEWADASALERVSETLDLTPESIEDESFARASGSGAIAVVRNPMRAVAFVSSVIAAVAIVTLLFLHRGP
jgi:predicted component of type VI protein secretion system